jgi:hypothetical protein
MRQILAKPRKSPQSVPMSGVQFRNPQSAFPSPVLIFEIVQFRGWFFLPFGLGLLSPCRWAAFNSAFGDPQSAFPSPVGFRRTGFFVSVHLHSWFLLFVPSLRLK